MKSDIARVLATLVIWMMGGGIVLATVLEGIQSSGFTVAIIAVVTLGAMLGGTRFVWGENSAAQVVEESEKSKRRGRLDRFVDDLSDQEREVLFTRLTESDGEVSLEELQRRR